MINKVRLVERILADIGLDPARLSLEWVSAAEGSRFVRLVTDFTRMIGELGPLGEREGLDGDDLMTRLKAAKMALTGRKLRMALGRMARAVKEGGYRELPRDHKSVAGLEKALREETVLCGLRLYLEERPRPPGELAGLLGISEEEVRDHFEKLRKKSLVEPDRLTGA